MPSLYFGISHCKGQELVGQQMDLKLVDLEHSSWIVILKILTLPRGLEFDPIELNS